MRLRTVSLVLPILLIAACGEEADVAQENDLREASGEILPGSISDDIIQTDNLQSQPPLLREVPQVTEEDEEVEGEVESPEPQTLEEAFSAGLSAPEAAEE